MSGIREPKKDGGKMLLVGQHPEQFKDAGGREQHFAPLVGLGMAAARFLPAAYRGFKAARAYKPMSETLGVGGRLKNIFMPRSGIAAPMAPRGAGAGFRVGSFLRQNPITTASLLPQAAAGTYAVGSGAVKAVPGIAKAYIDALIPGESIFREKDGSPKTDASGVSNINKTKRAIGMPENLTYRASTDATKKGGGVELSAEELRKKNVERYRDIMDIKGMNKDAAYNSLIAASQAINESGDFKGDIKSGKLINQIIQATSKQFDKPKQTKDAIDTLILKGEIEKDIKSSDPQNQKRAALLEKQIALADKQLAGESLSDTVNKVFERTGQFPSGKNLASVARTKGIDVIDVAKTEDIDNFLEANPGKNAVDFIESIVQTNIEQGKSIEPGAYVVKDRIIVIDSEGNVSPYL
jgi:hypothetical protein